MLIACEDGSRNMHGPKDPHQVYISHFVQCHENEPVRVRNLLIFSQFFHYYILQVVFSSLKNTNRFDSYSTPCRKYGLACMLRAPKGKGRR